jgi:hypothetical protein
MPDCVALECAVTDPFYPDFAESSKTPDGVALECAVTDPFCPDFAESSKMPDGVALECAVTIPFCLHFAKPSKVPDCAVTNPFCLDFAAADSELLPSIKKVLFIDRRSVLSGTFPSSESFPIDRPSICPYARE